MDGSMCIYIIYNTYECACTCAYLIVGNFQGSISRTDDLYHLTGIIFADVHTHAHYKLYNCAYLVGSISTSVGVTKTKYTGYI